MSIPYGILIGKELGSVVKVGTMTAMTTRKGRTPLDVFIEEELDRLDWSQLRLEAESGIPDQTISRIRAGQEPKPSQLARLAKAFGCQFWYILQRAGYTLGSPDDPSADAQRIGAVLASNPELHTIADGVLRLSLVNRRAVLRMIQALLDGQSDPPDPPAVE